MRGGRRTGVLVLVLVLALAAAGCGLFDRAPDPAPAVEAFLTAWRDGAIAPEQLADPAAAQPATDLLAGVTDELGVAPDLVLRAAAASEEDPARGSAQVGVTWDLPSGPWSYETVLDLQLPEDADAWRVAWSPTALHPQLRPGQSLDVRSVVPLRASILAADGTPLFEPRPVVTVGIQPQRVTDLEQTLAVVDALLDVDVDDLRTRVQGADPAAVVEVITLRRADYEPLRAGLQPIPGVVFTEGTRLLSPTRTFARPVLGRVGLPTAEVLQEAGPGFGPGDELGLSGLQRRFQGQLAGTPGTQIAAVDAAGTAVQILHDVPAVAGQPLRTTLDPVLQVAAEATLFEVPNPSALVALRPSTGEVLAVANGPDGGATNLAFTGQYPPGSTFKIVSAAAFLTAGAASPDAVVDCPPTATVGGRSFRNAEGNAAGQVPFREAFAESCNTTFAPLAASLPEGAVAAAAEGMGVGGAWNPGIDAYTGQVPAPDDDVERAAEAIGQGRVLASPLVMASVMAAVADGTWRPPVLLPDHTQPGTGPRPLDPAVGASLRDLTRAVVTSGTGAALQEVPGEVIGKSGTAEFGEEVPPRTHAWFVAARGDLAIAVLVEDGGGGAAVAAPLAARFLSQVPL